MAASKPGGRMLETGTGTGIGTCWLLDGMDATARLTTVDIDPTVQAIARTHLGMYSRLTIVAEDAALTIRREPPNSFDLIFADGGAGKHTLLGEAPHCCALAVSTPATIPSHTRCGHLSVR